MKRIAALFMVMLLLCAASASSVGFTAADDLYVGEDSPVACSLSGLYLVAFSGKTLYIEKAAPETFSKELTLGFPIASAAVYGDTVMALCGDDANEQVIVYTYEVDSRVLDSYTIPDCTVGYHRGFYVDANGILMQDDEHPSVIYRYSLGGRLKDSYNFQGVKVSFVSGYDASLYVLCDGVLYQYADGGYRRFGGAYLNAPVAFIADSMLADGHGGVYRIKSGQIQPMMQTAVFGGRPAAAWLDGFVYFADGGTLYRYDEASGSPTDYYEASDRITALYAAKGNLYAVLEGASPSILCISLSSFIPCAAEPEPTATPAGFPFRSDAYRIDSVAYRITRIPSPTTFAQLKAGVSHDGYKAELWRNGKSIKTGNVGTAMTVVFSGNDDYNFELSVIGDITGEGNVNSRDVYELMDYFLGNIRFDGVYADAADISDDGSIDMLDLALLCRMAL